ncbi:LacI family DNA-binding transcriptional regulator [Lactiplantibacillus daoliensis]|uniref:LacI family DNA-binding transcriptional regulator n=1 Tax=Lactiplantibacillus daoliensis TaxID=2559916 RepID=A0ABW1UIH0_9LACO|nr:LacI family DNA-binding transcriptional regulator [Lactiplantibacillus daoliensis]
MQRVTLTEVAKAAGVSVTTASRVLNLKNEGNQSIKIGAATQEKVQAVAQQLGYQQNLFASLTKHDKASQVIGIVIRDINDPLLAKLIQQIQVQLRLAGYETFISNSNQDFDEASQQIKFMLANYFDGIIIVDYIPTNSHLLAFLQAQSKPYVIVTGSFGDPATPVVRTDDAAGIDAMVQSLSPANFKHFGYVGSDQIGVGHRESMYKNALGYAGLPVISANFIKDAPAKKLQHDLQGLPLDQLFLFCATDRIALKVYTCLIALKIKVPTQVALMGFDGLYDSDNLAVRIGSVAQPLTELAQTSCQLLLAKINNPAMTLPAITALKPTISAGTTMPII